MLHFVIPWEVHSDETSAEDRMRRDIEFGIGISCRSASPRPKWNQRRVDRFICIGPWFVALWGGRMHSHHVSGSAPPRSLLVLWCRPCPWFAGEGARWSNRERPLGRRRVYVSFPCRAECTSRYQRWAGRPSSISFACSILVLGRYPLFIVVNGTFTMSKSSFRMTRNYDAWEVMMVAALALDSRRAFSPNNAPLALMDALMRP